MLSELTRYARLGEQLAEVRGMDAYQQRAFDLLTSPETQRAFDIHAEDEKTRFDALVFCGCVVVFIVSGAPGLSERRAIGMIGSSSSGSCRSVAQTQRIAISTIAA